MSTNNKNEQQAIKAAMAILGKRGGSITTEAKALAAAANGAKGGRRSQAEIEAEAVAFQVAKKAVGTAGLDAALRAWVKVTKRHPGVVRRQWRPEFGDIAKYLK